MMQYEQSNIYVVPWRNKDKEWCSNWSLNAGFLIAIKNASRILLRNCKAAAGITIQTPMLDTQLILLNQVLVTSKRMMKTNQLYPTGCYKNVSKFYLNYLIVQAKKHDKRFINTI